MVTSINASKSGRTRRGEQRRGNGVWCDGRMRAERVVVRWRRRGGACARRQTSKKHDRSCPAATYMAAPFGSEKPLASALCGHADHAAPCHVRCAACAADVAHPSSPPHRDSVTQCARITYLMAPVAQT